MTMSKKSQYTVAKVLHWIAGLFIAFNLLAGWKVASFELAIRQILAMVHSGLGVTILALMLVRWWWRLKNDLYKPPNWWKRPPILLQWIFYPLLLVQPVLGIMVAIFNDYDVKAMGFINFSAIAESNEALRDFFLQAHGWLATLLITLVLLHAADRLRKLYV